jgi:hypothetical protein
VHLTHLLDILYLNGLDVRKDYLSVSTLYSSSIPSSSNMQLRLSKALLGLLAFSPLFRPAQAHPYTGTNSISTGEPVSIQAASDHQHISLVATAALPPTKRVVPVPFQMVHPQKSLELTWSGVVKEPANSGWTRATIQEYAAEGWQQTQAATTRQVTLVSALWIPGRGVYLGSIPHALAMADKEHVEFAFETIASNSAPILWDEIGCRTRKTIGTTIWHAEDMSMMTYERMEKPKGRYPTGAYMTTFGQYSKNDQASWKAPCGLTATQNLNPNTAIVPACAGVLQNLGISH